MTNLSPKWWSRACKELSEKDLILKKIINEHKSSRLVSRGKPIISLTRSIVSQQISVKAAQSVWNNLNKKLGAINKDSLIKTSIQDYRLCGLSYRKAEYIRSLVTQLYYEDNLETWTNISDDDVIKKLITIKGIGDWTAKMFLMFCLNRPDIFTTDDVGILKAIGAHYLNKNKASKSEAEKISTLWIPWRTAASWFLWRSLDSDTINY